MKQGLVYGISLEGPSELPLSVGRRYNSITDLLTYCSAASSLDAAGGTYLPSSFEVLIEFKPYPLLPAVLTTTLVVARAFGLRRFHLVRTCGEPWLAATSAAFDTEVEFIYLW